MIDRNVEFPSRYHITKVDGTDDVYELVPAPGTVSAEGTPINKATLLTDTTAMLYGLDNTAVPDGVFNKIAQMLQTLNDKATKVVFGHYVGTGTYGPEHPNTLQFDFQPTCLIIMRRGYQIPDSNGEWGYPVSGLNGGQFVFDIWTSEYNTSTTDATYSGSSGGETHPLTITFTFANNEVSWSVAPLSYGSATLFSGPDANEAGWQYNTPNYPYFYIAM